MMETERHCLVLIPPPFHGHMTPMLQLATILYSKGFSITIAHTHFNSPDPSKHPNFTFIPFFDGLSHTHINSTNFIHIASALNTNCVSPIKDILVHLMVKANENNEKIACIIYDGLMHFIDSVAKELKLPSIVFRTTSATNLFTYHVCAQLRSKGYLPIQDSKSWELVPELELLRFKDLPIFNRPNPDDFLNNLTKTLAITPSLGVICNTMECLEGSTLNHLRKLYKANTLFPIGPLNMISNSSSFLQENHSCIAWLNNKPRKSVLYVSLGSIASWNEKELIEVAFGLVNSKQNFLWVIRRETMVNDVSEWVVSLPEDVKRGVEERGCVVEWAPQSEVLGHKAVGGFWSHCGWNSTLESLCEGVAIICQPYFGDQMVNARMLSHVWKVGLEWSNVIEREEIEGVVRRLMVSEEGKQMRKRAMKLKHEIKSGDSSSNDAVNGLVKCILSPN